MAWHGQAWKDLAPKIARDEQAWEDPGSEDDAFYWPALVFLDDHNSDHMMKCVAIHYDSKKGAEIIALASWDSWRNWLFDSEGKPSQALASPGFTVLLCPKSQAATEDYPWTSAPTELTTIPLLEDVFLFISKQFNIHQRHLKPLQEQYTHMPSPYLKEEAPPDLKNKPTSDSGDKHTPDSQHEPTLDSQNRARQQSTYSALFRSDIENYPDNIALAYTYAPGSSRGIFFGCSDQDKKTVYSFLRRSGSAHNDPLLLPAIFAELQTSRLHELRQLLVAKALIVNANVERFSDSKQHFVPLELTKNINDIKTDASLFKQDVATAQSHLRRLINNIPGDTNRFRRRFEIICSEYDEISGSCQVNTERAISNAQALGSAVSGHAANSSAVLAFVAVIYLPISTLASIFAIPIFDFKANWKDIHNHPVPTPSSSDAEAVVGNAQPVVVSYYLAHYLGISFALLILTLEGWYVFTRDIYDWKEISLWRRVWNFAYTRHLSIKLGLVLKRSPEKLVAYTRRFSIKLGSVLKRSPEELVAYWVVWRYVFGARKPPPLESIPPWQWLWRSVGEYWVEWKYVPAARKPARQDSENSPV
ncbi:hypothetical protein F5Y14DRAFT_402624 [Nemania sp. NC0429]|nr:hypothetical protein F5Y14DRAFT_402624 [Nemania sp. NC0429]